MTESKSRNYSKGYVAVATFFEFLLSLLECHQLELTNCWRSRLFCKLNWIKKRNWRNFNVKFFLNISYHFPCWFDCCMLSLENLFQTPNISVEVPLLSHWQLFWNFHLNLHKGKLFFRVFLKYKESLKEAN